MVPTANTRPRGSGARFTKCQLGEVACIDVDGPWVNDKSEQRRLSVDYNTPTCCSNRWAYTTVYVLLLLPVLFLCTVFGPGLQCIPPLVVPSLFLILVYIHNVGFVWMFVLWAVLTLGSTMAYIGIFIVVPALSAAYMGLLCVLVFLPIRGLRQRYRGLQAQAWHVLAFPVGFSALFATLDLLMPTGSFANYAYAFLHVKPLIQSVALFGLTGVNFTVTAIAALMYEWFDSHTATGRWLRSRQHICWGGEPFECHEGPGVTSPDLPPAPDWRPKCTPTTALVFFIMGVLVYGGAHSLNSHGQFPQTRVEDWEQKTYLGGCLIEEVQDMDRALGLTAQMAQRHPGLRLLLWSEAMITINAQSEESLIKAASLIARNHSLLLGVTYKLLDSALGGRFTSRNMLVLLRPDGTEAMRFQKANPVVGVEWRVQPGPGPIPPAHVSGLGAVGAAICFDFDFPAFIAKAAHGADLLLQPGADWGPLGFLHADMDALRAVENGVTLFRCASGSVSGVYGPYGERIFEKVTGGTRGGGFVTEVPVRHRFRTPYSIIGETFAYLCILLWGIMLVLWVMPAQFVSNWTVKPLAPEKPQVCVIEPTC